MISNVMTHTDCVLKASAWLKNRCRVVFPEFHTFNEELPDVIGFRGYGDSVLIECKVSRADFLRDKKKPFRIRTHRGMGKQRYYCCPAGVIKPNDLPEGWGLIYIYPSGFTKQVVSSNTHERNIKAEHYLLYTYAVRSVGAGTHRAVLDFRVVEHD